MKPRAWLAIAVSALLSGAVWALSPWLVGHLEPWDADGPFYPLALLVAGVVAGLLIPGPLWAHYLGACIGQFAYEMLFLDVGPLLVLGLAFLLAYSVVFLLGAAIGGYGRARLTRHPSRGHVSG